MLKIYLAGNISKDPQTYLWRQEITQKLSGAPVEMVDPCRNGFNQLMRNNRDGGLAFTQEAARLSQNLLRPKDYKLIEGCDLMVVNLAVVDISKPLIGTITEMAWAHDIFYMPIIGIMPGTPNIYSTHPWVIGILSAQTYDIAGAVNLIQNFFIYQ